VDYLDSAALAALFAHADDIDIHIAPLNESLFTICGLTDITNVQVIRATPATPDTSASPD
jgi:anti-sigma B factor antagonist